MNRTTLAILAAITLGAQGAQAGQSSTGGVGGPIWLPVDKVYTTTDVPVYAPVRMDKPGAMPAPARAAGLRLRSGAAPIGFNGGSGFLRGYLQSLDR